MPPCTRSARTLTVLGVFAAMALAPSLSWATNKDNSLEVSGALTFIRFDPQSDIESETSPTLLVGYNFTKRHGGEISFTSFTARPDEGPSFPIDLDIFRFGYIFNAYPKEKMVTFFRTGGGYMAYDPETTAGATDRLQSPTRKLLVYGGGGIRFFFRDNLALRIEGTIDFIDSPEGFVNPDIQGTGSLGVSFLFGGREQAAETDDAS